MPLRSYFYIAKYKIKCYIVVYTHVKTVNRTGGAYERNNR